MENNLVALNADRCREVAKCIKPLKLKPKFYQREYLSLEAGDEMKFRMNFYAVAICHQTYTLYHPSLNLYGWDFIEQVFVNLVKEISPLLQPEYLAKAKVEEISGKLAFAFSHTGFAADCSLDRLDERARLMKEASQVLMMKFGGEVKSIFEISENRLLAGGSGLYELFQRFEAFTDPRQKKSTFLIKLLEESDLIKIKDPENFIPIMDYHMQRVLLRLGCVEIVDADLRKKIIERKILDSDEPIRSFCIEAFKLIAKNSEHPVTKMNDFFWSLGRSCCHETTLCHDHVCEKSPCTFAEIVEIADHSICIFESICPGSSDLNYRQLWQPMVDTHFY